MIPFEREGRVLNSSHDGHIVRVSGDAENTGGFVIFERWDGSSGPNGRGEFDSWVEDEKSLSDFFAEAGWQILWEEQ